MNLNRHFACRQTTYISDTLFYITIQSKTVQPGTCAKTIVEAMWSTINSMEGQVSFLHVS